MGRLGDLAIGDHLGAAVPGSWLAWQCTGNFWVEATNTFGSVAPLPDPPGAEPVAGCFDVPVIQTATFVIVYGSGRLTLDFLRGDDRYAGLTASQWTAFAAVSIAVAWVIRRHARHAPPVANNPGSGQHSEDDESTPAARGD